MPDCMQATVLVPMTVSVRRMRTLGSLAAAMRQRLQRQIDARRDDAAAIIAVAIDHVESGRGAEIDDDQRAA